MITFGWRKCSVVPSSVLTEVAGVWTSCFLLLLGLWSLPWTFLIFWPISDSQFLACGQQFSFPVCFGEAWLRLDGWRAVCGGESWAEQQTLGTLRLLLATGWSSVTQSHCSSQSGEPSLVSSLRLARRSPVDVPLTGLWGIRTRRDGGVIWPGDPCVGDNHCLMEHGVLWRTTGLWEGLCDVVLEGRGRAAPLGAQAASWGEVRPPKLSDLWLLAGVDSTLTKGPKNSKNKRKT